jgi:Asp-tRNA(Asn)/Glu-tRNA(Gln) amidotransferase A subunit family amidase
MREPMLASPRISGPALRAIARLAQTAVGASAVYRSLRAELKIDRLAALPDSMRGDVPLQTRPLQGRPPRAAQDANLGLPPPQWSGSSATFVAAYRNGSATPEEVTARALDQARSLEAKRPNMGPLLEYAEETAVREARDSARRYRDGRPIGALDGVPFAVKEQTAVRGLARRAGTVFVDGSPQAEDATCVGRLRAAGAIVVGTTPMTEFGMSPIGFNSRRSMPRNPHAEDRAGGGSSTGSGVAVATGLLPFALGADGGGSIRIPAALNGVFGIKPTWGRVSRAGDISTGSVAHLGPLASSTLDLARVLELVGAPDPADPETEHAPPLAPGSLVRALGRGVRGLRVGVAESEWRDAAPEVADAGQTAIRALEREGATIVKLELPMARHAPSIGYVSIGIEGLAALRTDWRDHRNEMSRDLVVTFAALAAANALEYVDAQRLRAGLRREVARAFEKVDLLALPTTAATAPRVTNAQMRSGFLDARVLDGLCRFTFLGNLTGLPAASMPVGCDGKRLPIGFQLVGDAWDEATVLAATAHLERLGVASVVRPAVSVNVLPHGHGAQ